MTRKISSFNINHLKYLSDPHFALLLECLSQGLQRNLLSTSSDLPFKSIAMGHGIIPAWAKWLLPSKNKT